MYNVLYSSKLIESSKYDLRFIETLRLMDEQINYFIKRIRMSKLQIPNDHILSRLIRSFNVNEIEKLKLDELSDYFDLFKRPVIGSLGIGDADVYAKLQKPHIYENVIGEIWVSIDNQEIYEKGWRDIESVKILYHPFSSMNVKELYKFNLNIDKNNYAIIGVDCKAMVYQYIQWRNAYKNIYNEVDNRTVGEFVRTFVLTNAIKSHINHVIANRWMNILNQNIQDPYIQETRPLARNLSREVDVSLINFISLQKSKNLNLENVLMLIPLLNNNNLLSLYKIPFEYLSDQVMWVVYLMRLNLISTLLRIDSESKEQPSRSPRLDYFKNQIKRSLEEAKQGNIIPLDFREWFYTFLQKDILTYL